MQCSILHASEYRWIFFQFYDKGFVKIRNSSKADENRLGVFLSHFLASKTDGLPRVGVMGSISGGLFGTLSLSTTVSGGSRTDDWLSYSTGCSKLVYSQRVSKAWAMAFRNSGKNCWFNTNSNAIETYAHQVAKKSKIVTVITMVLQELVLQPLDMKQTPLALAASQYWWLPCP